jgi:hypothetical protein
MVEDEVKSGRSNLNRTSDEKLSDYRRTDICYTAVPRYQRLGSCRTRLVGRRDKESFAVLPGQGLAIHYCGLILVEYRSILT